MATGMVGMFDRPLGMFSIEEACVLDVAPGTVLLRQERVIS